MSKFADALAAGYSKQEIVAFLRDRPGYDARINEALSSGYSEDEIVDHLHRQEFKAINPSATDEDLNYLVNDSIKMARKPRQTEAENIEERVQNRMKAGSSRAGAEQATVFDLNLEEKLRQRRNGLDASVRGDIGAIGMKENQNWRDANQKLRQDAGRERTWGEAAKDVGVQLLEGGQNIAGAVPDLVAPDSEWAQFHKKAAEFWRSEQSEPLKARAQLAGQAIDRAGEDGVIAQVVEAASQYWDDPILASRFVVTNLPSMVPGIAAAKLAQAGALARGATAARAMTAGVVAAGGVNAGLNAGGARGEAFEDIKQTLIKQGMDERQANEIAKRESIVPAMVGGVTGAVSGSTGLERAFAGGIGRPLASGLVELAGEQAEEVLPKVTTNLVAGRYDDRSPGQDVGRTMVETAIGSAPGAALASGMEAFGGGDTQGGTPKKPVAEGPNDDNVSGQYVDDAVPVGGQTPGIATHGMPPSAGTTERPLAQLSEFEQFVQSEREDIARRRIGMVERQAASQQAEIEQRIPSEVETKDAQVLAARQRTDQEQRLADLERAMRSPNPMATFAELRTSKNQPVLPEDSAIIKRRMGQAEAFQGDYAPGVEPSLPDGGMSDMVPERKPVAQSAPAGGNFAAIDNALANGFKVQGKALVHPKTGKKINLNVVEREYLAGLKRGGNQPVTSPGAEDGDADQGGQISEVVAPGVEGSSAELPGSGRATQAGVSGGVPGDGGRAAVPGGSDGSPVPAGTAGAQGVNEFDVSTKKTRLTPMEDPRVQAMADDLRNLSKQTGWQQEGGRLLRKSEDYNSPDYNEIVGRTKWIPHAEWYGGMATKLRGKEATAAVEKAIAVQPMTAKEKRFVAELADIAQEQAGERQADKQAMDEADAEARAEREAIMAEAELAGLETTDEGLDRILEAAFSDTPGAFTDEEIFGALNEGQEVPGPAETVEPQGPDEGSGQRGEEAGQDAGQAFSLTGQTPEEVRAEEQARADREKADKDAADKAEAEARKKRIAKEVESRQRASAENFQLGQSAEDALAGQGDLLSAPINQNQIDSKTANTSVREKLKAEVDKAKKSTEPRTIGEDGRKEEGEEGKKAGVSKKSGQIEDFGEKLGGARKDMADAMRREWTDDEIAQNPLSKVWPKADVDAIEDKFLAAFAHTAREEIPTKPRKAYAVAGWVQKVKMLRGIASKVLDGVVTKDRLKDELAKYSSLKHFSTKVRLLESIDREQWSRIGSVQEWPDAYTYSADGKEKIPAPQVVVDIDGRGKRFSFATLEDAMPSILESIGQSKEEKALQFEVRGSGKSFFINKKGDPLYRKLKTFDNSTDAIKYRDNNYDDLVAAWEGVKERENVKETDVRGKENRPRSAKDWRNGKDATADDFIKAFGFRGVEWGNWVAQGSNTKERQGMLNQAYDALMDLADIIGVPAKAISLNGSLGLGFGSRGHGWASAHFEPDTLVINLTKTRGAGSLGHEWFHALDNYFQRERIAKGEQSQRLSGGHSGDFITYNPENYYVHKQSGTRLPQRAYEKMIQGETVPGYGKIFGRYRDASQWEFKEGVRPEVGEAFADLVKALNDSPMAKRAALIDKGKSGGYWSKIIERGARSFENYLIHKMALSGYHNDYLANVTPVESFSRDTGRYPYLLPEEIAPVAEAFDGLFGTIQTKETDKGVAMFSRSPSFISPLTKAIESAKQESMPAAQWALWLDANKAKLGLKEDELYFSGIRDYLTLLGKDKVTKAEIADYLSGNGVRVEGVVKGGQQTRDGDTKFSGYWDSSYKGGIPGTYREILVTLTQRVPEHEFASIGQMKAWLANNPRQDLAGISDLDAFKAINKERRKAGEQQKTFQSSHWSEPNVLVHVRLDEVTGADGKRYVRVGEIQSDWGQKGKKEGFGATDADIIVHFGFMPGEWENMPSARKSQLRAKATNELGRIASGPPSAPFVTDTKAWVALGIKRAIMHAVDVGADGIVFGTGQQNADLYDLSKQVSAITARQREGSEKITVSAERNGDTVSSKEFSSYNDPAIADFVGKEIADKIATKLGNAPLATYPNTARFTGLDLKVGGDGMRAFYDKIVPQVSNDVLKKLGGGKVGSFDIEGGKQPGFTIPPEMRENLIEQGMPLFARNGGAGIPHRDAQAVVDVFRTVNRNAPEILVLEDVKEAKDALLAEIKKAGAMDDVEGAFHDGKIYLFANNLASTERVAEVLTHEGRHFAFRAMKGKAMDSILMDIHNSNDRIRMAAKKKMDELGIQSVVKATEEVLADMDINALRGVKGWKAMVAHIRLKLRSLVIALRKAGLNSAADWLNDRLNGWTDADVAAMLKNSDRFVRSGRGDGSGGTRMSRAAYTIEVDGVVRPTTNSTGQRIAQTEEGLRAFYKWFGDSKVVDEQGRPLVVYHGTAGDFTEFNASEIQAEGGFWFAERRAFAQIFGPHVVSGYLAISDPLEISEATESYPLDVWRTIFEEAGVDGVVFDSALSDFLPYAFSELTPNRGNTMAEDGNLMERIAASGFDGIHGPDERAASSLGKQNTGAVWVAFSPTQIKSATGNRGTFDPTNPDIRFSRRLDNTSPSGPVWDAPVQSTAWENIIYELQDKHIDTKRVVEAIKQSGEYIAPEWNPHLQEQLFHGRAAKGVDDFLNDELRPLVEAMAKAGVNQKDLNAYLHARHAKERNEAMKAINEDREDNDGLSGLTDEEADTVLESFSDRADTMEDLANHVDRMIAGTRRMLVGYGLETQETVSGWAEKYEHYVPLHREGFQQTPGTGQGYSIRGKFSKLAAGSRLPVDNILAHVAMQRERAIVRGEKNRVAMALYSLALLNPNNAFWSVDKVAEEIVTDPDTGLPIVMAGDIGDIKVPRIKAIDKATGQVTYYPDPTYKGRGNVVVTRINGKDYAVIFNERNELAMRMAESLKNLDVDQMHDWLGKFGAVTRYFASINTQYNPVFGLWNLMRDVPMAALNLSSTAIADKRLEVMHNTSKALSGIYRDARAVRNGKKPSSDWADLWEQFQRDGGQTGYRDLFRTSKDRANAIQNMMNPDWWQKTWPGKLATAGGLLAVPEKVLVDKVGRAMFDWLSDFNLTMENAIRLAAYKVALDDGMDRQDAAALAKNLTVNFNKKGRSSTTLGALFAFFNASVQGTARIAETIYLDGKMTKAGQAIVFGGIAMGAMQSLAMALAGFDDDEPPEWIKERSLVIPVPGTKKGYVAYPYPLGYHVLPNIGRHLMDYMLSGFEDPGKRVVNLIATAMNAFNPLGTATVAQTATPTVFDPLVALAENQDFTGNPIYSEDMSSLRPTPGESRAKDSATLIGRGVAVAANRLTGGTKYTPGWFSPTPDQIDYLLGQLTGGVGREAGKLEQTVTGLVTGDLAPMYKVPIIGRMAGSASSESSQRDRFYRNLTKLNTLHAELKGLRKERQNTIEFRREHPELRMLSDAAEIQAQMRVYKKSGKRYDERLAKKIEMFNAKYSELQDR